MFYRSPLSVYEITLSRNDRIRLIDNLPDFPNENRLYEDLKKTIKAEFRFGDYKTEDAKIRYRGKTPYHWYALKKSWSVTVPEDDPLGERTNFNFITPQDRGWVEPFLWNHVREKLGLLALDTTPVHLEVNKKDMGLYILMEGLEEEFLVKHGRQPGDIFSDLTINTRGSDTDLLMPSGAFRWQSKFDKAGATGESYPHLMYLLSLAAEAPQKQFDNEIENILDMETFNRWMFTAILSGNFHSGNNAENMNLYFNPATGKFEIIPIEANITPLQNPIDLQHTIIKNRLVNRVLQNEKFRKEFENLVKSYVSDQKNLDDDLAYYDQITEKLRPEIESDTVKLATSYEARRDIASTREMYIHNFSTLRDMLNKNNSLLYQFSDETYPVDGKKFDSEKFKTFLAINTSREEFLSHNNQFVAGLDPLTIILLPGKYVFTKTVIVPKNLKVIIREGVSIYFAPGISLLSYSTVEARGTTLSPIIMKSNTAGAPWGIFAIIGTPSRNFFRNVHIENGKDDTINGMYFSGNLSVYGSDLEFIDGSVSDSHADDGIHILEGEAYIARTIFTKTSSDSIDIDFTRGANSIFENNTFRDIGGDAIDLSFSEIMLRNNTVAGCGDKGVSVGEASKPLIEHMTVLHCVYGIAVKDRSRATIRDARLIENETGIGLYRKKPFFIEGGVANVSDSVIWGNKKSITTDKYSYISASKSVIQGGYEGNNNTADAPDLKKLLPQELYKSIASLHI